MFSNYLKKIQNTSQVASLSVRPFIYFYNFCAANTDFESIKSQSPDVNFQTIPAVPLAAINLSLRVSLIWLSEKVNCVPWGHCRGTEPVLVLKVWVAF